MAGWRNRVEDLLYSGESVVDSVDFESASVVVTSHRVLAFSPDGDGPAFQQVDRPNVEAVTTGAESELDLLQRGVKTLVIGFVLVGAGLVIDFESIVGDVNLGGQSSQQLGLGGVMGTLQQLLNLITQLDRLMRIFGALALFLAVVFLGVFWFTRDRTLVIEVAGDDDIHLPRPSDDATEYADRLETLIAPGDPGDDRTVTPPSDLFGES